MCVRARSSARVRVCVCACGIIEKKCVHAAEDTGSAEEEKNNQKERMRQRETVIWNTITSHQNFDYQIFLFSFSLYYYEISRAPSRPVEVLQIPNVTNREVLQTESGSIFGKVRVRVLAGQGQSTHEHVRTESLFCKEKIDFRFHFWFGQFRWRSDWGRSRRFWRKPCCSRVTKWPWRGRTPFCDLGLLCKADQCGRDW